DAIDVPQRRKLRRATDRQALTKEEDPDSGARLLRTEEELKAITDQIGVARAEWEAEREVFDQWRSDQEELDRVKTQIEAAERDYDLEAAAKLRSEERRVGE